MRRALSLLVTAVLVLIVLPVSADVSLSINATPRLAHVGDTVMINGTVAGSSTIAVYLFVTGTDLDPRGVTLENLNIPAGHGLFTTAPVRLSDGSWSYSWDTSVILGTLKPGNYTLYVLDTPVDHQRFVRAGYASTDIQFIPPEEPVTETPVDPFLPVLAVGITSVMACSSTFCPRKKD